MNAPTVYVVDDDDAVRASVSLLLKTAGLAVETYDSAEAFLAGFRTERPGCLVLDMRMTGMSGFDLQDEIARRGILMPIVFLTAHGDIPMTVRAMKAGAMDFLTKPVDGAMLLDRIQAALARGRAQHEDEAARQQARERLSQLSEREQEILALAVAGYANKEIARQLGISFRTVETHRSHILLKTGAATLLELAQLAAAGGLSVPTLAPSQTSFGRSGQ